MLNADSINYVCDDDNSLTTSLMRVYADKIKSNKVNILTCQVDKTLSKRDAYVQYKMATDNLHEWKDFRGLEGSLKEAGIDKISYDLKNNNFYDYVEHKGRKYPVYKNNSIEHPFPHKDDGVRYINCLTDLSHLSTLDLAKALYNVDSRAINTYFNQIRRRISILERPMVSSRGEGKSYIYSNFNPKYANYMLTILRTYLNFCNTFKYKREDVTPAMQLGITNKPFTIEDIIYFK
jgi:hypothetical protein